MTLSFGTEEVLYILCAKCTSMYAKHTSANMLLARPSRVDLKNVDCIWMLANLVGFVGWRKHRTLTLLGNDVCLGRGVSGGVLMLGLASYFLCTFD